jgi:hypothetical protein
MLQLPDECVELILNRLARDDVGDMLCASQACSKLRQLATGVLSTVDMTYTEEHKLDSLGAYMQRHGRHVTSVSLGGLWPDRLGEDTVTADPAAAAAADAQQEADAADQRLLDSVRELPNSHSCRELRLARLAVQLAPTARDDAAAMASSSSGEGLPPLDDDGDSSSGTDGTTASIGAHGDASSGADDDSASGDAGDEAAGTAARGSKGVLAAAPALQSLCLQEVELLDDDASAVMGALAALTGLQALSCTGRRSETGWRAFALPPLLSLTSLKLSRVLHQDAHLQHFGSMTKLLQLAIKVDAGSTSMTGAALSCMSRLRSLTLLKLAGWRQHCIGVGSTRCISSRCGLQQLCIKRCGAFHPGPLCSATALRELRVCSTPLGAGAVRVDALLSALHCLHHLTALALEAALACCAADPAAYSALCGPQLQSLRLERNVVPQGASLSTRAWCGLALGCDTLQHARVVWSGPDAAPPSRTPVQLAWQHLSRVARPPLHACAPLHCRHALPPAGLGPRRAARLLRQGAACADHPALCWLRGRTRRSGGSHCR